MESQPAPTKEWNLEPKSEYRFELDPDVSLAIRLVKGKAEIFGSEIAVGRTYLFGSECKAAVFTWHGCTIEVTGQASTEYVSDETPMTPYINLHLAFEQSRVRANRAIRESSGTSPVKPEPTIYSRNESKEPPRVMFLGPENSGKTSAIKILANYAVRSSPGWSPMIVNVDPGEGGWTVPGTISACPITMPIPTSSPANPLGSTATTAPTALTTSALLPLVFWYGHAETKRNPHLYERLLANLGEAVRARFKADPMTRASGLFLDTPASFATSTGDNKFSLVQACVEAFDINVILVVGHEKLSVEMQRLFGPSSNKNIIVLKIPKSGGVVELDHAYRQRVHAYQQRAYFYGLSVQLPRNFSATAASLGGEASLELGLSPYSSVIGFDDITIYRIGGETMAPSSALPVGASRTVSEMQPVRIDPSQRSSGLLNALLALLAPASAPAAELSNDQIPDLDVAGFVLVSTIDMANRKMTILSPNPGNLAGRIAILGSFEWQDQ